MVDRGESTAAMELANTLRQFGGMVADYGIKQQQTRGAQEGTIAGASGRPNFQKGWRTMTAYGQAYNNAATRSYAIKAEADAEDQAARLEVDAANDPSKFEATFGAVAKSTIKAAPPEARAILTEVYNRRMTEGRMRLINAQATEQHTQARSDLAEGVARANDRIARMRASGDPAQLAQADEEEVKRNLMIDGAAGDGTISPVERIAYHQDAINQTFEDTIVAQLEAEIANPKGDPAGFILKFDAQAKLDETLSPEQKQKLHTRLVATLADHQRLANLADANNNAELKARWAESERDGTARFIRGTLTSSWLAAKLDRNEIDPAIARTLSDGLRSHPDAISDSHELLVVEPNLLSFSEEDILKNSHLSNDDKRRLILKRQDMARGWQGSPEAQEGNRILTRGLGIQPGTNLLLLSSDQVRQLADAQNEYYTRGAAMDPAKRQAELVPLARELVGKFHLVTANKKAEAADANAAENEAIANDPNVSDRRRKQAAENAKFERDAASRYRQEAARAAGSQ